MILIRIFTVQQNENEFTRLISEIRSRRDKDKSSGQLKHMVENVLKIGRPGCNACYSLTVVDDFTFHRMEIFLPLHE